MDITLVRGLLWIAVICVTTIVTMICPVTTATYNTEVSTVIIMEETEYQSSAVTMTTETESPSTATISNVDMTTTTSAPVLVVNNTALLLTIVMVMSALFMVMTVGFLVVNKDIRYEDSGGDCADKGEEIESNVLYNPTFVMEAGIDEPDIAVEEKVKAESSKNIVHEVQAQSSRQETTEQAKRQTEDAAEADVTQGEVCIVPINEEESTRL